MVSSLKTRFCPSPTGLMHLGNARTALFNFLFAKGENGTFLLRIEDTDVERSKPEYDEALQYDLKWLGLDWQEGPNQNQDNGPYHQSKRQSIYNDYYQRLESSDQAYPCFCSQEELALARKIQRASGKPPRYPGTCRSLTQDEVQAKLDQGLEPTLRFRVPDNEVIRFNDLVRGEQQFQSNDIGDFIIRRANGTSPFMFCNAIDDALMGVTHVLRGEDHLTNTPRQVMILEALGLNIPTYGHISLIVAPDGSPLSKRSGSRGIGELREEGYLPSAIVNYLARLGHYYESDAFMALDNLAEQFKIESLSKSPAKFNVSQLDYWQKQAVEHLSDEALWQWLGEGLKVKIPEEKRDLFVETVKPNIQFPQDVEYWIYICNNEAITIDEKHHAILQEAGHAYFDQALAAFEQHENDLGKILNHLKSELDIKGKALYQPLRIAITGIEHGPELAKLFQLLEPQQIKTRLENAKC